MKKELTCSIVQDLLPNYIEKLTSDESNIMIEEHLDTCEDCKTAHEQMIANIENSEKVPVRELKFLKKIKRTRLLAAALCVVMTLVLSYLIYASEFKYTNDKANLSAAITEFTAPIKDAPDAYVLETKEIDGVLVASFKDLANSDVNGIAVLTKGFNQKYRIIQAKIKYSDYSSVVQFYPVEIKDENYYAVSGYNLSDEIKYYGLDYNAYTHPGHLLKDRVRKPIKFEVKNQQFLEFYTVEELDSIFKNSVEDTLYYPLLLATSLYDENGMEITEDFRIQEYTKDQSGPTIFKAELFLLYVFIAIVVVLGCIFIRYFLTE